MKLRSKTAAATPSPVTTTVTSPGGGGGATMRLSEEEERQRPEVMCTKTYPDPIGRTTKGEDIVGLSMWSDGRVMFKSRAGEFAPTRQDFDSVKKTNPVALNCVGACRKIVMLQRVYHDIDVLAAGLWLMKNPGMSTSLFCENHLAVKLLPRTSDTPKVWPADKLSFNGALIDIYPHKPTTFLTTFNCEAWDSWMAGKEDCLNHFRGLFRPVDDKGTRVLIFSFTNSSERDKAIEWFTQNGALVKC
ncbi:hypothetical protein Pelo_13490 [Pelomyxa schiedti]|nr:hypothetical protein Pelo_13490 [Pelomyxa schiedti]